MTLIIGLIYRGHQNPRPLFLNHLEQDLEYTAAFNLPTVIVGDFNFDLSSTSGGTETYVRIMKSFFLEQHVKQDTRVSADSATLLDHFWSNADEMVTECKVLKGFSDHKMISATINLRVSRCKKNSFSCRSYKRMDQKMYIEDLRNIDWSFIEGNDIELIWSTWKEQVKNIINKHTKIIEIRDDKSPGRKPWIDEDLLKLIRKKQAAEIRKEYFPTQNNISNFKKI